MDDLSGGTLAHYQLLGRLGAGGMGVVYLAQDERLGRRVAIKVLPPDLAADPERIARLGAEARALAAVDHPGIVTIHAVEEAPWSSAVATPGEAGEPLHFLVMEAVEGRTLAELITATGVPAEMVTRVGAAVAEALAAAHARGVVHRDLKPSNVMVATDGRVKVLDFGLAKRAAAPSGELGGDDPTVAQTQAGWIAGTLPYMAPEQLCGAPVTPATDVFALGVLLYEMACGRRPFLGPALAVLAGAILHDEPDWGEVSSRRELAGLVPLLRDLLAKRPKDRPEAAEAARRLLRLHESEREAEVAVPSLAVLPFADLSPDRDQRYFCDGLVDELLTALTALPELRVVSRTSVARFRDTTLDPREIAEQLGVGHLVEGSVRRAGDRLRVGVHLASSEGFQLWSERYERDLDDVFAVQEEIAERIVEALAVSLGPKQRQALARASHRAYTRDTRAYDAYLRGRAFLTAFDRDDRLAAARVQFETALARDPEYAPALAALARLEAETYRNSRPEPEILESADELARRALALAPDLAEAHTALGKVLGARYDYAGAAERFRRAADLQPDDPVAWDELSWALGYRQPPEPVEAERAAREAIRLQPSMVGAHYHLSRALIFQGRLDEAEASARHALELDPSLEFPRLGLTQIALIRRDLPAARAELERLDRIASIPVVLVLRAMVEAAAGNDNRALHHLETAVERGYRDVPFLLQSPDLARLRERSDLGSLFEPVKYESSPDALERGRRGREQYAKGEYTSLEDVKKQNGLA